MKQFRKIGELITAPDPQTAQEELQKRYPEIENLTAVQFIPGKFYVSWALQTLAEQAGNQIFWVITKESRATAERRLQFTNQ